MSLVQAKAGGSLRVRRQFGLHKHNKLSEASVLVWILNVPQRPMCSSRGQPAGPVERGYDL